MNTQQIKQRFGIIGTSPLLDRAIDIAAQVALTDLSVLITGESGVGKEIMPQIIHQLSARKHNKYIAVNCGAIPEGTIDSELFGHEKGAFTGAHEARKGYFEVADGGTIFLDEIAELPIQTQVRLLRVLETGEFIKVGSSKVLKTDIRVVAATNVTVPEAIRKGKFREDLFYRLNTVPIHLPSLRERKEDVHLLFRKFASDFANKYRMPPVKLNAEAVSLLENFRWTGNVRQLKNVAEQVSVIESSRDITAEIILNYLPEVNTNSLPTLYKGAENSDLSERDILYKVLFDLKGDVTELKHIVLDLIKNNGADISDFENNPTLVRSFKKLYDKTSQLEDAEETQIYKPQILSKNEQINQVEEVMEESLSLADKEKEMITKALDKYLGKRKKAAEELGISERTLYRKIKEYAIEN
ncbi:MAG: sigma-54-dependent Fis family transcriptional regulator [Bacteroidetes bacterium RIFCSPLOWO2_12_FULL_31_6]|nr:MAG: sigma-54-dependent Fis family transcriptional regulator [Bacteroidetes bacterium RIFCSPLOWO2_12_FULL_31_6]